MAEMALLDPIAASPRKKTQDQPLVSESPGLRASVSRKDPWIVRWGLTLAALSVLGVLVIVPLVHVFVQAFGDGARAYWRYLLAYRDTRHAILLTPTVEPR